MNKINRSLYDRIMETGVVGLSLVSLLVIALIFGFIFMKAWPVLSDSGFRFLFDTGFDIEIGAAFSAPESQPMLSFGAAGLVLGTLISTGMALVLAVPMGIGMAIVICEFAPSWLQNVLMTLTRLLSSIPSIVFGLVGLMAFVPWVEKTFISTDMQILYLDWFQMTGKNLITTVIVLTFMIVPMIVTLSCDAIRSTPSAFREVGFAMGMSHWRVVWKVVLPCSKSGILAGVILAAGRGIGEAIAVSMVCGGIGLVPDPRYGSGFFLQPILTLASAIINKSEAISAPAVESALFACGAVLLLMGAALSMISKVVEKVIRKQEGAHG